VALLNATQALETFLLRNIVTDVLANIVLLCGLSFAAGLGFFTVLTMLSSGGLMQEEGC
jgi:hypothetical protein